MAASWDRVCPGAEFRSSSFFGRPPIGNNIGAWRGQTGPARHSHSEADMLSLNSVWFFSSPCGKGRHRQRLKIEPRSAVRGRTFDDQVLYSLQHPYATMRLAEG